MNIRLKFLVAATLTFALTASAIAQQGSTTRQSTVGTSVRSPIAVPQPGVTLSRGTVVQPVTSQRQGVVVPLNTPAMQQPMAAQYQYQQSMGAPVAMNGGAVVENCGDCSPAPTIADCDCAGPNCDRCRILRSRPRLRGRGCNSCGVADGGCVSCPQCQGDICQLKLDNSKEKKTCFKVEQVPVCIPPVRLPWKKCCPPGTSKTRLVTKLKKHKYECPSCKYKWSLVKPEIVSADKVAPSPAQEKAPEPKADVNFQEGVVPPAPKVKGAFLRPWRSR